jgi:hypothetical protein
MSEVGEMRPRGGASCDQCACLADFPISKRILTFSQKAFQAFAKTVFSPLLAF